MILSPMRIWQVNMKTFIIPFLLLSQICLAGKFTAYLDATALDFTVKGKTRGSITKKGEVYTAKKLYTKISAFKSGLDLRDKHLKEKLNMSKYPKILLTDVVGRNGAGSGTLSINGKSKKHTFTYKIVGGKLTYILNVNLSDFGVKGIKYMGVGIDDKVKIKGTHDIK